MDRVKSDLDKKLNKQLRRTDWIPLVSYVVCGLCVLFITLDWFGVMRDDYGLINLFQSIAVVLLLRAVNVYPKLIKTLTEVTCFLQQKEKIEKW